MRVRVSRFLVSDEVGVSIRDLLALPGQWTRQLTDRVNRRWVARALNDVAQEREFGRVLISLARADGREAFVEAHTAVRNAVMDDVEEILEETSVTREDVRSDWFIVASGTLLISLVVVAVLSRLIPSWLHWLSVKVIAVPVPDWIPDLVGFARNGWHATGVVGRLELVLIVPAAVYLWRQSWRAGGPMIASWRVRGTDELRNSVRPRIRIALNDYATRRYPQRLLVADAPALGEVLASEHLVDRREFESIEVLSRQLGASAIAVSGSRGVGKTALLRRLCDPAYASPDSDTLSVRVSAPVTYDTRDFLINLYRRLCQVVLSQLPDGARHRPRRFLEVPARLLVMGLNYAIAVPLLVTLATAITNDPGWFDAFLRWAAVRQSPTGLVVPSSSAAGFAMTVIVTSGWVLLARLRHRYSWLGRLAPVDADTKRIATTAERELVRLGYLLTLTTERSTSVSRSGLQIGRRVARQVAEQPISLPELVDSYRQFVADVATWWGGRKGIDAGMLVGIDELDRIADPNDADAFLNNIKSIFDAPGCTYVVTISDEALASFERRIVHLRTALDSVFDEVLRLERMTFDQSAELLDRRVVAFPLLAVLFCHCLAGGVPRDLVRSARTLIDTRIDTRVTDLSSLIKTVVKREIAALCRGFVSQLQRLGGARPADDLTSKLSDHGWPPLDANARLAAIGDLYSATVSTDLDGQQLKLASGLLFLATVEEVFTSPTSPVAHMSRDELADRLSAGRRLAEDLARVRDVLPVSASIAFAHLQDVRKSAGLAPVRAGKRANETRASATTREIRAWALRRGIDLPSRGRIPAHIRDSFHADQAAREQDNANGDPGPVSG